MILLAMADWLKNYVISISGLLFEKWQNVEQNMFCFHEDEAYPEDRVSGTKSYSTTCLEGSDFCQV